VKETRPFSGWTVDDIVLGINQELERARAKFPAWSDDLIHNAAIVVEEGGELLRAALQCHYEDGALEACDKEAIQTAAMCFRFLMGR